MTRLIASDIFRMLTVITDRDCSVIISYFEEHEETDYKSLKAHFQELPIINVRKLKTTLEKIEETGIIRKRYDSQTFFKFVFTQRGEDILSHLREMVKFIY